MKFIGSMKKSIWVIKKIEKMGGNSVKLNKRIVLLCLTMMMIISVSYLLPERVKAATKAADGAIIIETLGSGPHAVAADTDGKDIYYSINFGGFEKSNYNTIKRNIKTGKEVGVIKNKEYSYYGYDSIKLYKDYFIGVRTHGSSPSWGSIDKVYKTGKVEELAVGNSAVVLGNSIYYIAEKKKEYGPSDIMGIYKMDMNGKNKKLVKKGNYNSLGISGKNLYYAKSRYANYKVITKWFNLKTGKREKNVILSYRYDKASKTKFVFTNKVLKAGKYKNGKWEYKAILKHNTIEDYYYGIFQVRVCGSKILVQINEESGFKLYMLDLNGKNKKLLKKGGLVS